MNINAAAIWILAGLIGLYAWRAYLHWDDPPPSQLPWVPIDVRKTKVYVSQTRDAGMFVERQRRTAILRNPSRQFSYKGFDNGVVEAYLTAIAYVSTFGAPICPPAPDVIWSGGNASTEAVCAIVDGGNAGSEYDIVDFGGAGTTVCDV